MQTCADSRAEDIKVISHTKILLCCDKMQMSSKSPDTLALSSFLYAFFFFFYDVRSSNCQNGAKLCFKYLKLLSAVARYFSPYILYILSPQALPDSIL